MAAPRLDAIEIQGQDITADARLTQRQFATYRVEDRQAHDHFTIKGNQPTLIEDVTLPFAQRQEPDFVEGPSLGHGRIETRKSWTRAALNDDLDFPPVGQVFLVEREHFDKKTGQHAPELAHGITSRPPEQADAQRLLNINRGPWSIENSGHDGSTGTLTKITVGYAPAMVQKTSPASVAWPSGSSKPKAFLMWRRR